MLRKEETPAGPAATTVRLIGSKWKLLSRSWVFRLLHSERLKNSPVLITMAPPGSFTVMTKSPICTAADKFWIHDF